MKSLKIWLIKSIYIIKVLKNCLRQPKLSIHLNVESKEKLLMDFNLLLQKFSNNVHIAKASSFHELLIYVELGPKYAEKFFHIMCMDNLSCNLSCLRKVQFKSGNLYNSFSTLSVQLFICPFVGLCFQMSIGAQISELI